MITTYEVRNVLRVYGNHLKKRSSLSEENGSGPNGSVDLVDISMSARRKQMLSQISNRLISGMMPLREKSPEEGNQVSAPKLLANEW